MRNFSGFASIFQWPSTTLPRFFAVLLVFMCCAKLQSQMTIVVNSNKDDQWAHPFDNPNTTDIDESTDGFCMDSLGRCTLRAGLEEASAIGIGAAVIFAAGYTITLDLSNGPFSAPDNSSIHGNGDVIFKGGSDAVPLLIIENNTRIQGIDFFDGGRGLFVSGNNNLIGGIDPNDGNAFTDFSVVALTILGNNNVVKGNFVGVYRDNTNNFNEIGIQVLGSNTTIGGITPEERNFISGNNIGISVISFSGGNTFITGNFIGTDLTGTEARANLNGIEILGPNTRVGGLLPEEMNVISGNLEAGILIGIQASDNAVIGNHIGVGVTGVEIIPNRDGIILGPGSFNTLVENNQIVSNTQVGIFINGLSGDLESHHHKIRGNTLEYNSIAGIIIQGNCARNIIGSSITQDFDPNVIQFNGAAGVAHVSQFGTPTENTIRKNAFRNNGILGIDNCVTCQDAIPAPVLSSYTDLGLGVATITGTHAIHSSIIDVYKGEINSAGVFEGMEWFGSGVVNASGEFLVTADPCDCDTIVATATNPDGSTSQFSNGFAVMTTSVKEQSSDINSITIFPNPFHDATTIEIELQHPDEIYLNVFDTHGRKVATLCNDYLLAGIHQWNWKPATASDGIYYFRLTSGNGNVLTGKLILIE